MSENIQWKERKWKDKIESFMRNINKNEIELEKKSRNKMDFIDD